MSSTVRSPRSSKRKPQDAEPTETAKSPRKPRVAKSGEAAVVEAPKPADPTHSSKMHTLIVRSITGIVMMFGFTLILMSNHTLVAAFVVLLQIMVYREMTSLRYKEAKEKDIPLFRSLNWFFLASTMYYVYGKQLWIYFRYTIPVSLVESMVHHHLWHSFVLYITGFLLFVSSLRKDTVKYQFGQLTWMLMTLLSVVVQSSVISVNIYHGLFWFMLPHSMIICNDIMAYFVGMSIGRKIIDRPLTKLSPNKTWEGFFGAAFFTVIFAFIVSGYLGQVDWFRCSAAELNSSAHGCAMGPLFTSVPIAQLLPVDSSLLTVLPTFLLNVSIMPIQFHMMITAIFASVVAPFGGFFASAMKRAFQKKDFDQLLPGHGGVTDRMDCQFLIGLFIYVYYATFIKPTYADIETILQGIYSLPLSHQHQILAQLQQALAGAVNATVAAAV